MSESVAGPNRLLEVYDQRHQPHLVMTLHLTDTMLDVEPSDAAKEHIEQDLRQSREDAHQLPVIGWLLERAVVFAEHRMADYFGQHDLHKVQMHLKNDHLQLHVGRAILELGPGEINGEAARGFVAEFNRLKSKQ